MTQWYTADPHFGHDKIIRYCDRPFRSTAEMDAAIRGNYMAVAPDDDLWIIGDFGFGASAAKPGYLEAIFARIPGRKHLVIGNHDGERVRGLPWASVHDLVQIRDGDMRLTLCHYPMITWAGARKGGLQLFGHVHEDWLGTRNSVNVGVDVWEFQPVRLPQIVERAAMLPPNIYYAEVEHGAGLDD